VLQPANVCDIRARRYFAEIRRSLPPSPDFLSLRFSPLRAAPKDRVCAVESCHTSLVPILHAPPPVRLVPRFALCNHCNDPYAPLRSRASSLRPTLSPPFYPHAVPASRLPLPPPPLNFSFQPAWIPIFAAARADNSAISRGRSCEGASLNWPRLIFSQAISRLESRAAK